MPDGTEVGQSDFSRNERQQKLLLALRNELDEADLLFELPAVLRAIARSVSTDVPRGQAGDLASLLPLITGTHIERVVLGYPDFVEAPANPDMNYLLVPRRDAIREEMARLFGADALTGWYLGTTAAGPNSEAVDAPSP
jgi:anionic cell wall polymer biosynthesis LytR-Cps2A-Psr (LCP) family protein